MKLAHPCKDTCSGYSQDCVEQVAALQARVKELESKLEISEGAFRGLYGAKRELKSILKEENAKLEVCVKDLETENVLLKSDASIKHKYRADCLELENAELNARIKELVEMNSNGCDLLSAAYEDRNRFRNVVDAARFALHSLENQAHLRGTVASLVIAETRLKESLGELDGEKPDYYYKGRSGTQYTDSDPEVTCRSCSKTFRTDPFDRMCRLCGKEF